MGTPDLTSEQSQGDKYRIDSSDRPNLLVIALEEAGLTRDSRPIELGNYLLNTEYQEIVISIEQRLGRALTNEDIYQLGLEMDHALGKLRP